MGMEGVAPPPPASRPCVQDHRCQKGTAESSRGQPPGVIGIPCPHLLHLIDPRSGLWVIFASAAPGSMLRLLAHLSSEASLGRRGAVICFQTSGLLFHRDLAWVLGPSVVEEALAHLSEEEKRVSGSLLREAFPGHSPESQALHCSVQSQALIYHLPTLALLFCHSSVHLLMRPLPRGVCPSSGQAVPVLALNTLCTLLSQRDI